MNMKKKILVLPYEIAKQHNLILYPRCSGPSTIEEKIKAFSKTGIFPNYE